MRDFLVFDCETDSFDGKPVVPFVWGWIKSNGERGITYSEGEFVAMLREFDGIALAHNGGKFDTVLLSDYFERGVVKIINGRLAEIKIGKATVRDSFLIIPESLAQAGNKDDFDYSILDRNKKHLRKKYKQQIEKYLMQDCVTLFEMVNLFYSLHGQRLTQAGAALASWEAMGGMARRWGGAHDTHFRNFYYGGRCEAFQKGALGDGWNYYDIKSAYPFAMLHSHPASHLSDYTVSTNIKKITPQSFARIVATSRGCLPTRGKYSTEYPHHTAAREYFATGWEIIAGMESGNLKIESATVWTPGAHETLAPYVNKYYADKIEAEKAGDKIKRGLAKRFLNSLYGKYGAAADDYKAYLIVGAGERPRDYTSYLDIGELDIVQKPAPGQFYDVALAASITGFARSYLYRQMLRVADIAYSDTDSIICKGGEFLQGDALGNWEHVCIMNNFHVAGKKLYAGQDAATGEWVTAHKGFSALDTGHEDIIKVVNGANFTVTGKNGETAIIDGMKIKRSAPTINISGAQNFIDRTMRKT